MSTEANKEPWEKLMDGNLAAAEKHRIAYGETMYNKAIQDVIEVAQGFISEIKTKPPSKESLQSVTLIEAIIYVLISLKKPSQSPNQ